MSSCFPRGMAWQSICVHVNTNGIRHLGLSYLTKCSPVVLTLLSSKLVTLDKAAKIPQFTDYGRAKVIFLTTMSPPTLYVLSPRSSSQVIFTTLAKETTNTQIIHSPFMSESGVCRTTMALCDRFSPHSTVGSRTTCDPSSIWVISPNLVF